MAVDEKNGGRPLTALEKIIRGELKLPLKKRLCLDLKPKEIPPLPKGEEALKPHTKAGWQTEGIIRSLINNLHQGTNWETLFIYGGSGKAVRNWKAFYETIELLKELEPNETLFMQSGVPYGKMLTHPLAPRCVITNSIIVPNWTMYFEEMVEAGLTVYGQMTAGSWIYIGTQGILQGTYETIGEAIKVAEQKETSSKLSEFEKWLVVSAGLGSMSGAQPLAIKMNGKIGIIAEINPAQIERQLQAKYLDHKASSPAESIQMAREFAERKEPTSIGVLCNATELLEYLVKENITPLVLTDQTSAHDMLNGYVPEGMSYEEAVELREKDPEKYKELSYQTVTKHVRLMVELQNRGAETFDYGNNIRGAALQGGYKDAFSFPGFVQAYIRPLFMEGRGPFRWQALSNDPEDIYVTDEYAKKLFHDDERLVRWIEKARQFVPFEKGLPSRVFWAGYRGRAAMGMLLNKLYADGKIKAPVVIGRDHLDGGSVASPYRETEGMIDGSDAIGDYAVLNFAGNALSGATWVSYHGGGGVGVGNSLHAGQVIVADGERITQEKIFRVLMWDPMTAILRHAHAGYQKALEIAEREGIVVPMKNKIRFMDYRTTYESIRKMVKERTGVELWPPMEAVTVKLLL